MDPEAFKTPWKIVEDELHGNTVYTLIDNEGSVIGLIGNCDHAQFIVHRINRFFEGL